MACAPRSPARGTTYETSCCPPCCPTRRAVRCCRRRATHYETSDSARAPRLSPGVGTAHTHLSAAATPCALASAWPAAWENVDASFASCLLALRHAGCRDRSTSTRHSSSVIRYYDVYTHLLNPERRSASSGVGEVGLILTAQKDLIPRPETVDVSETNSARVSCRAAVGSLVVGGVVLVGYQAQQQHLPRLLRVAIDRVAPVSRRRARPALPARSVSCGEG